MNIGVLGATGVEGPGRADMETGDVERREGLFFPLEAFILDLPFLWDWPLLLVFLIAGAKLSTLAILI